MNQPNDRVQLTPAEEDPVIHQVFTALPAFAPAPLFDDRVLTRVWRPEPEWARNVRSQIRELRDSGRIWLWVGLVAMGSLIPSAVLALLGAALAPEVGQGMSWVVEQGLPAAVAAASADVTAAWSQIETHLGISRLSGTDVTVVGAGSAVLLLACSLGLARTLRPSRVRRYGP